MVPPVIIPAGEAVIDINEVMQILPHRYPFLLVDRIVGFEGENKCTGVKSVTINEPFFQGTSPAIPSCPACSSSRPWHRSPASCCCAAGEYQGKIGYFMSADKVKFRKPVMPGDTLFIEAEILRIRRSIGQAKCRCVVNNETVSEGDLMFSLMPR